MSVLCSDHNLAKLEEINSELEVHCYALELLKNAEGFQWPGTRFYLLFERIDFLQQTCKDLQTFEAALRQGKDLDPDL